MLKTILSACIFLITLTLTADDAIRMALRRSSDISKFPNDKILVVFDSTRAEVSETGLGRVYMHQLVKILNNKGALDKRVVIIGYDPLSAFVRIESVNIYKANGDIISIDTANVKDYPAPARAIYWGAREKMLEIGRLEPGDAIQIRSFRKGFTYALLADDDDRYIPPMRGHFYDIVPFWSSDPVLEKVYSVSLPANKLLQYEFYNGEVRVAATLNGDRKVYTFTKSNIIPLKSETSMVAWSDVAPKLLLSTSPDWQAKSLWFYNVNEDYGSFESTPPIDKKTKEILINARTEMDSISLLTHWVADEMRYSGLSMGPGEGYTLHKGEMNFTDRCGVCKDKAGLLITMLRAAGFKSWAAMTMAGERIDYIPADQFNHSVTVVQLRNGEYMLLDPTWVPFNRELWSSLEQQQGYLMGLPEGADLMYTPVSAPENHILHMKGNAKLFEDGTLEGRFEITGEGQSEAAVRGVFSGNYRSEWEKNLEREILRMHPAAQIVEKKYTNPDKYLDQPILIEITYRIPGYAVAGKNAIVFRPMLTAGLFARAQSHLGMAAGPETRQYPFRDRCSKLIQIEETIELPGGFGLASPDYRIRTLGDAASISGNMEISGNRLYITQTVTFNKRIYEPGEWPNFRDVVKTQRRFMDEPLLLLREN
jgi:hypothetical protein